MTSSAPPTSTSALQANVPSPIYRFVSTVLISILLAYFLYGFSHRPLWHTDLWGHLSYGRLISQTDDLPQFEPFLLETNSEPIVDTAWLAQLLTYRWEQLTGVGGLQILYGSLVTSLMGLACLTFWKRTSNIWLTLLGTSFFIWLEWEQIKIIRPQLIGTLFFCLLWFRFQFPLNLRLIWWVPPLLVFWANLHGSFIMGVGLIGCHMLGRAIDVYRETKKISAIKNDADFLLLFVFTSLALAVPLLNPYGLELYTTVLTFSGNPNLYDLVEWKPLSLSMRQGKAAAVVSAFFVVTWFLSKRRIPAAPLMLLCVLGTAMVLTSRMIIWWAPIVATQTAFNLQALWSSPKNTPSDTQRKVPYFRHQTTVCASIILIGLAVTATSLPLQHIEAIQPKSPKFDEVRSTVSWKTPVKLAAFLKARQQTSESIPLRIFSTMDWGDYLIWTLEANHSVFVYSHVHLISQDDWQDYLSIMRLESGWESRLEKSQINTIILDKIRRKEVIKALNDSPQWKSIYEDNLGIVFTMTSN